MKRVLIDILRWLLVLPVAGISFYIASHVLKGYARWIAENGSSLLQGVIAYVFISMLLGASFGYPGVCIAPKRHKAIAGVIVFVFFVVLTVVMCVKQKIVDESLFLNIVSAVLCVAGCAISVCSAIKMQ